MDSCRYCQGALVARDVTRLQPYQGTYVIIENLPALVCEQCGKTYYTPEAHDRVLALLQDTQSPQRVEAVKVFDAAQSG